MQQDILILKEAITYQQGAVVSREVLKNAAGTVTLFAFDKGQGLSEHTAPFTALMQVIEGVATVSIDGEAHTVREGGMIELPANHPHALDAPEQFKMLLTMIRATEESDK